MMRESMFEFRRKVFPVGAFSAALLLTGCLFQDVRSQQSKNGDVLQNQRLRNN